MSPANQIYLPIEIDILTSESVAELVNAVLEFLLYQRNQIPLVYKTYKYYISKWKESKLEDEDEKEDTTHKIPNFNLERQRESAKQTKDSISEMCQLITKEFEVQNIRQLRFLFGATSLTPVEAYTIHIPTSAISRKHSQENHRIPHSSLNKALISLLTSEKLYTIFSNNLCPTNMFLELEIINNNNHHIQSKNKSNIFPKDVNVLPPSCKDIHIILQHSKPLNSINNSLKCCKELEIFTDIIVSIEDVDDVEKKTEVENIARKTAEWWEADIYVRGFKEKPIKAGSIWTN